MQDLKRMMSVFPMAVDQWLMVLVLIHVFGFDIPWYVWLIFGLEAVVTTVAFTGGTITWQKKGA